MKITINLDKKVILKILFIVGAGGLFFLGLFLGSKFLGTRNLKQYTFTAKNYVSQDPLRRQFTFSYSPKLEVVVKDANLGSRRIKLKPQGEEIEASFYISLDEPGQSLGEGIRVDKPGELIWFGNNQYTKHNVYYDPENRLVMVIYDPQLPLELGDAYVSWWDEGRREEALDQAKIILETLKQVK